MTLSEFLHFFPTPLELVKLWPGWLSAFAFFTVWIHARISDKQELRRLKEIADAKRAGSLGLN